MLWNSVKKSLQSLLPESEYGLWIKPMTCCREDDATLELACPDRFFCAWVEERYLHLIKSSAGEICGTTPAIRLTVNTAPAQLENNGSGQLRLPGVSNGASSIRSLHPAYTFDQFMVGESNMLARSACGAIAAGDRTFGNCLFMNSDTGLGKSHLTQGVVHHVMAKSPATRMQYLTAQQFSAAMVKGIRTGSMEQFSRKFINGCDLLLVEDVHTLTGKTKTQEELNNILDYLIKSGKRVILTSAVAPRKLKGLDEDFRSRMTSGLVTDIEAPDYATREAIIRHKASVNDLSLSEEQVEFMARHLRGDVRRIESAIIGIKAKSCLRKEPSPDMELVRRVLHGLVDRPPQLNGETIRDFVGCQFKVSIEDLQSRSRKRAVTFPRQVAMYLTRKYTEESLADIGSYYNRDHSTVLHAIKVITRDMTRKTSTREQVEMLCRKLKK
jgi:chromosomal replication initiator protein